MKVNAFLVPLAVCGVIGFVGCNSPDPDVSEIGDGASVEIPPNLDPEMAPMPPAITTALAPVPIEDGVVTLNSENTSIRFIGSKPDGSQHLGGFKEVSGTIELNEDNTGIESLKVEIATDSLWADDDRLQGHLKSPDFFEVETYPTATFESTSLGGRGDETRITGELTLHGETKTLMFPAEVEITEEGLTLTAQTEINRMDFGIDFQPDQINAEVPLTVVVSAYASEENAMPSPATFGGPAGGPTGGGPPPNPERMFHRWDQNKDGTLADDEIPDRLRERLDQIDRDGDGAVSFEEFRSSGGMGGGRGPGPGGPGGGPGPGGPGASETPDAPDSEG